MPNVSEVRNVEFSVYHMFVSLCTAMSDYTHVVDVVVVLAILTPVIFIVYILQMFNLCLFYCTNPAFGFKISINCYCD